MYSFLTLKENIALTWRGEIPKWTASEALDWGETETMTIFPLSRLERNSSKLCFSSIIVSADVTHPLHGVRTRQMMTTLYYFETTKYNFQTNHSSRQSKGVHKTKLMIQISILQLAKNAKFKRDKIHLHAKQSLREIFTGSAFSWFFKIETFIPK